MGYHGGSRALAPSGRDPEASAGEEVNSAGERKTLHETRITSPGGQLRDHIVKREEGAGKVNSNPTGQGGGSYRRRTVDFGIRQGTAHRRPL